MTASDASSFAGVMSSHTFAGTICVGNGRPRSRPHGTVIRRDYDADHFDYVPDPATGVALATWIVSPNLSPKISGTMVS